VQFEEKRGGKLGLFGPAVCFNSVPHALGSKSCAGANWRQGITSADVSILRTLVRRVYFFLKAMRLLHLVGSRGNSAEFPENTLPGTAFGDRSWRALHRVDVHLPTDGVPMVCNEIQFARVTGEDDADMSGAQMSALDVSQNNRFGDRFLGR